MLLLILRRADFRHRLKVSVSTHVVFFVHSPIYPLADKKVLARKENITLRADFPFPLRRWEPVYFEITIPSKHPRPKSVPTDLVSLGFCGEFCDQTQAQPGWNVWSVGYHGNNGGIFEQESRRSTYSTGRNFGPGDTVGCGIDFHRKWYFFTFGKEIVGMSLAKKCHLLYGNDLLIEKHVQPASHHLSSFAGSYTLLLVTVDKHSKSS